MSHGTIFAVTTILPLLLDHVSKFSQIRPVIRKENQSVLKITKLSQNLELSKVSSLQHRSQTHRLQKDKIKRVTQRKTESARSD